MHDAACAIAHPRDARDVPCPALFANETRRVKMPVKGLERSTLLALGAIVIYQLALLYQHECGLPWGQGIKPVLRAA